jgi:AraC-like DNA-binding protein
MFSPTPSGFCRATTASRRCYTCHMYFPCFGSTAKVITSLETVYPVRRTPSDGAMLAPKGGSMFGNEESAGRRKRSQPIPPVHDQRIESILQTIEADPASDVTALARVVHLSRSRLSHLFKCEVGRSLYSYLADRRLEKAAELLKRTGTPVKEVSYIVGYRHAPSFVRAFRKKFGCAPNDCRSRAGVNVAIQDSRFG